MPELQITANVFKVKINTFGNDRMELGMVCSEYYLRFSISYCGIAMKRNYFDNLIAFLKIPPAAACLDRGCGKRKTFHFISMKRF